MKHAREDYNRIQDPGHKIPEGEPVFLLRGQDINAPLVVEYWAGLAKKVGAEENIVQAAIEQSSAMRRWQNEHGAKIPDLPPHDMY